MRSTLTSKYKNMRILLSLVSFMQLYFQIAEIFAVVLNKTNDLVIIFKTALFHKISVNSGISNLLA